MSGIAASLGSERCEALPAFHALTGCDTTSRFGGKGKVSAWSAWHSFEAVTPALATLCLSPSKEDIAKIFPVLERFVVVLYYRCSQEQHVNSARQKLFAPKNRDIENLPPTQDALQQHVLRVAYQAGYIWDKLFNQYNTFLLPVILDGCDPQIQRLGYQG